ncbi:hypothetical protein, conserved [Babesia bigemina]|uniref:RAP domain-containing protein n=1 Tax=Babesia bigemina TaxID=5866 RepID=A0A061D8K2_BABBI|nr:hypothetical protein, conserved [Babesia bigemina]CDR95239.1 hypothetical protein, conserved [Babesia bigemina]|eukprot:XP_012767425.1 hypothetical protein, conserved [Babesia bigemina]
MSHVTHLFKCILKASLLAPAGLRAGRKTPCLCLWVRQSRARFHDVSGHASAQAPASNVSWLPHGSPLSSAGVPEHENQDRSIYVNEVCMQTDQLLARCEDHEDLLVLLVTHRGVMYLHNLVTAIRMLQGFAERDRIERTQPDADDLFAGYKEVFSSNAYSADSHGDDGPALMNVSEGAATPTDDAYRQNEVNDSNEITYTMQPNQENRDNAQVAIRGTLQYDPEALTETQRGIVKKATEDILTHFTNPANRHYLSCRQHSRPVAEVIVRDERYDLLLHDLYENRNKLDVESACHIIIALDALEHRYFRLYNGILRHIMRLPLHRLEYDVAHTTGKLLLKACQCYVRAGFYDTPLYSKVCREIYKLPMEHTDGHASAEMVMDTLRIFAKVDVYDHAVFSRAATLLPRLPLTVNDLSHVAVAYAAHHNYSKMHDEVLVWIAKQIQERHNEFGTLELARCVHAFASMRLYFAPAYNCLSQRLIDELETATHVYTKTQLTIPQMAIVAYHGANFAQHAQETQALVRSLMTYLEEHIDALDEKSAIMLAFASCATNAHETNPYVLSFLLRKIGSGTVWEEYKYRVFAIWLYQVVRFPELTVNIPKRCITAGMREWLLRHGNGTQFGAEIQEMVHILQNDLGPIYMTTQLKNVTPQSTKRRASNQAPVVDAAYSDAIEAISALEISLDGGTLKIVVNETSCRNDPSKPIGVDLLIHNLLKGYGVQVHSVNFQHWRSMTHELKKSYLQDTLNDYLAVPQ